MACRGVRCVCVCVRMSLRKLECKSASLVMVGGESLLVFIYLGPGSKSPYMWFSICEYYVGCFVYPSITLRAVVSTSSLRVTPVCDLTLPICVLYPMMPLVCMMLSASCRKYLWEWWMKLSGSMA